MRTNRPDYMGKESIPVFRSPRTNSIVIFSIRLGEEVEILERDIKAIDNLTGAPYKNPILLHMIRFDEKIGYVNRRWLE